jgi:hypothetical protein
MMKRFGGSIRARMAKRAKTMATSAIKSIVKRGVSRFKRTKIYKRGASKAQRAFHMLTNKSSLFQSSRQLQGMTNYGSATGPNPVITGLELTDIINTQGVTPVQREGNRIHYKGYKINALFVNPYTLTTQVNLRHTRLKWRKLLLSEYNRNQFKFSIGVLYWVSMSYPCD